jgi:hypothetical protein
MKNEQKIRIKTQEREVFKSKNIVYIIDNSFQEKELIKYKTEFKNEFMAESAQTFMGCDSTTEVPDRNICNSSTSSRIVSSSSSSSSQISSSSSSRSSSSSLSSSSSSSQSSSSSSSSSSTTTSSSSSSTTQKTPTKLETFIASNIEDKFK